MHSPTLEVGECWYQHAAMFERSYGLTHRVDLGAASGPVRRQRAFDRREQSIADDIAEIGVGKQAFRLFPNRSPFAMIDFSQLARSGEPG